jgi:hypothetical protein
LEGQPDSWDVTGAAAGAKPFNGASNSSSMQLQQAPPRDGSTSSGPLLAGEALIAVEGERGVAAVPWELQHDAETALGAGRTVQTSE